MRPDVARWLEAACADAEARGLAELKPLLEGLARSTDALRNADPALTGAAAPDSDDVPDDVPDEVPDDAADDDRHEAE